MTKPIVAIVGRPNVGKSTFFNKIAGRRISIVEDKPGVTRDRIYIEAEWLTHKFIMIDTGGIEIVDEDVIMDNMKKQAELAIETADVIIFMLDGREGLTTTDEYIAEMLRKTRKPVLVVVNKVDQITSINDTVLDAYTLGLGNPMPISSANGLNLGDLLDDIVGHFPEPSTYADDEDVVKVALIGKPNVGKSSIINRILGEERVIVSHISGTTRDAIDTPFEKNGRQYVLIDTAGIRRRRSISENVEKYSVIRSLSAIERADVCFLVLDAEEGISEQDKRIAGYAHEAGRAMVIVVNKWDVVEKNNKTYDEFVKLIRNEMAYLTYAPMIFISAKTGKRTEKLIERIDYVHSEYCKRVSTGALNDLLNEAVLLNQPPSDKGKRLKIYYMTQVSVKPPKFVLFVNSRDLAHFSYIRYLENKLREAYGFDGTPVVFEVKEKRKGM
ncbi:MAG: ribosome biogenesis GTPase Der [Clostridiales bacterium]|nr:MAG: ribosome biogenesis GTPase Der [Clostridiales bacterium]